MPKVRDDSSGAPKHPHVRDNKYWPTVGRIDNVFGDRNFACSCAPVESYMN